MIRSGVKKGLVQAGSEMGQPKKHRDLIIAWANGAEVQLLIDESWVDIDVPSWLEKQEYRIKPKTVKQEGWINVYRDDHRVYESEKAAQEAVGDIFPIACVHIEWEEWEEEV